MDVLLGPLGSGLRSAISRTSQSPTSTGLSRPRPLPRPPTDHLKPTTTVLLDLREQIILESLVEVVEAVVEEESLVGVAEVLVVEEEVEAEFSEEEEEEEGIFLT